MNWEAFGAIGEFVGAIGVIASLLYVGVQVRQNTRSVRAATYDSLVRSNGEWLKALIADPDLASGFEVAVADWGNVDEVERPRTMYLITQLFRHWENAYFQYRQGTLAPAMWRTWERIILSYFHQPGLQQWWRLRRAAYSEEFRDFLEGSTPPEAGLRTTRQLHGMNGGES